MKKNAYLAPEMELIELEVNNSLLAGSDATSDSTEPGFGGDGEPGVDDPD